MAYCMDGNPRSPHGAPRPSTLKVYSCGGSGAGAMCRNLDVAEGLSYTVPRIGT